MGFLDRLRTKTTPALDEPATGLGDASPTHYLTDNPEAEAPSDPWRHGFTRRRFIQGGAAVALGCAELSNQLITMSEFGRRIAQNNNNGTDHGDGNCMFMLGGGVRGGEVYTTLPGLDDDQRGDLRSVIDYRQVLGEWMTTQGEAASVNDVFPGFDYSPLGFTR